MQPPSVRLLMRWVVLTAFVVLLVWLGPRRLLAPAAVVFTIVCSVVTTARWMIKGLIVPLTVGMRCPDCGGSGLRYVGCMSFGHRFYRCEDCGLRCKRGNSSEPWFDASGPEDDAVYNPKAKGGPSPCSGWLPDRRDAFKVARAAGAFLAVFGLMLGFVAVGLWISPAWGGVLGMGIGLGVVANSRGKMAGVTSLARDDPWDGER